MENLADKFAEHGIVGLVLAGGFVLFWLLLKRTLDDFGRQSRTVGDFVAAQGQATQAIALHLEALHERAKEAHGVAERGLETALSVAAEQRRSRDVLERIERDVRDLHRTPVHGVPATDGNGGPGRRGR